MTRPATEPPAAEPPTDPHYARSLARVRRVSRAGLYTEPALTAAARLLVDLERTGEQHGITPDDFSAVTDLPGACLDVTAGAMSGVDQVHQLATEQGYPSPAALAAHLVDVLHARLADELDVLSVHRPGTYSLTFTCGRYRRGVRAGADGWHYDTDGPGRVDHVYAPYTEEGARAVADVMAEIVTGTRPDPLAKW